MSTFWLLHIWYIPVKHGKTPQNRKASKFLPSLVFLNKYHASMKANDLVTNSTWNETKIQGNELAVVVVINYLYKSSWN